MNHVQSRLEQRQIDLDPSRLQEIAQNYDVDTAVVLGKRISDEGIRFGYVLIVLIVRARKPITIMTRRQSQNFDKRNFNVQNVVYL